MKQIGMHSPAADRSRSVRLSLLLLAALAALTFFYLGIVFTIPYNSDDAAPMLMAQSVLSGNPLLRGWDLGFHGFLTTEVPFYVLSTSLLGFSPLALYAGVALQWGLLSGLVILVAALDSRGAFSTSRALTALCITLYFAAFLIKSDRVFAGSHLGALALSVLCLLLIGWIERSRGWLSLVLYGGTLSLILAGDAYGWVSAVIPGLLVYLYRSVRPGRTRLDLALLFTTLGAVGLAFLAQRGLAEIGAARVPGLPFGIVELTDLEGNIRLTGRMLLDLFSIRGSAAQGPFALSLVGVARLLGMLALGAAALLTAARIRTATIRDQVILATMVSGIFAFVATTLPFEGIGGRHLLTLIACGAVLLSEQVGETWAKVRARPVLAASLLALAAALFPKFAVAPPQMPNEPLVQFLLSRRLETGYAPYWTAAAATLQSHGKVHLQAVYSSGEGMIQPFPLLRDRAWAKAGSTFAVVDTQDPVPPVITRQQVVNTFGPPVAEHDLDRYLILEWDRPLVGSEGWQLEFTQRRIVVRGPALWVLPRQVGLFEDGVVRSSGMPGFLIYGPYEPLVAGVYQLTVFGHLNSAGPDAWADVTATPRGDQLALLPLANHADSPGVIAQGVVSIPQSVTDVQVRVHVGGEDALVLTGYDLIRME